MSILGAGIETSRRLTVGNVYHMSFSVRDQSLELESQIVWCQLDRSIKDEKGDVIPIYRAGVVFPEVITSRICDIELFIEMNKIDKERRQLVGRFDISPNKSVADMDYPYEFDVKKISLSGMLIEVDIPMKEESTLEMDIRLDGKPFHCKGMIVSLQEVIHKEIRRYQLGIKFIEMSEENRVVLSSYIRLIQP